MSDAVRLEGLSIEGYRSFGPAAPQRIGPLSKVHLVAGPNNSGKSNILGLVQRLLPSVAENTSVDLDAIDLPYGHPPQPLRVGLMSAVDAEEFRQRVGVPHENWAGALIELLREAALFDPETRELWIEFERRDAGNDAGTWGIAPRAVEALTRAAEKRLAGTASLADLSRLLAQESGGLRGADAGRVLVAIAANLTLRERLPKIRSIGAFRQIAAGQATDDDDLNGPGLIERLARLQHPQVGQEHERKRFDRINAFLGVLFDDASTRIEVPYGNKELLVIHDGRRLPLTSYGTGVHQAVILAAAATVLSEHLVCVEEPEVHMHPTLQRKLLRYLRYETDNQYLIATHSAHMLDSAVASISAVRQVDGQTVVETALEPAQVAAISAELGMRASDLVQANAVVWVEGPSDRVYLREWLRQIAPELVEGVHYSLLFYGGALLSHLSPEDPAVDEFIALPRINRNFWVVIDSDKRAETDEINATKTRVVAALETNGSELTGSWVTAGYTVENYVPPVVLQEAVRAVHPKSEPTWNGEQFANPLGSDELEGRSSAADKAAVAREVVERWSDDTEWPYDLRERVGEIATMIRKANDLPVDGSAEG